ncbi:MAG: aryl-sulfate sulfotransferase [Halolamina sp.]
MHRSLPPRRWLVRGVVFLLVLSLLAPAAGAALGAGDDAEEGVSELGAGTMAEPANNSTVVSIQGYHFQGQGNTKKPARVVSASGNGSTEWVYEDSLSTRWFYDVDPLPNGNLLVVSTNPGGTTVYELNRDNRERVWQETLPYQDTHDIDVYNDTHLAIANMRNWNESCECSDDRVVLYDREDGEVDWEWRFRDHYPNSTDGGFSKDWTHLNDVEVIRDGEELLLSPRNFDQVIAVDIESKEITERLGEDEDHDTLYEQHNPDWLTTDDGDPTILVADSENDRVVEYTKNDEGEWEHVWSAGSSASLSWPRDADRLPNGNTLVVDSMNHRVIEITPQGEIVWEYVATWGPYDVERIGTGDESNGPTMRDQGVSGHKTVYGAASGQSATFSSWLAVTAQDTPVEGPVIEFAGLWGRLTPWFQPVWLNSWQFASLAGAVLVLLGWGAAEVVYHRERLVAGARAVTERAT